MAYGDWCACNRLPRVHNHNSENGCPEDRVRPIDLFLTIE